MGRRKSRRMGGGGGGMMRSPVVGLISQVIGGAFVLFALILFGIALSQLDTAYTNAATYTEQVGLTDIMGIWGMITFLIFVGGGLAVVAGGAVMNFIKTIRGGWIDAFMSFAMGAVSLVIAYILNTIIQAQLHTQYTTAGNVSEIANYASFSGLLDIMTIFGMIIFLTLAGSGVSAVIAAAWGAVKQVRSGF